MLKRLLMTVAAAGTATAVTMAPVAANAAPPSNFLPSFAHSGTVFPSTSIRWDIAASHCVIRHNSSSRSYIGARSREEKFGFGVNRFRVVHYLQKWSDSSHSFRNVTSHSFSKSFPSNGVFYYQPSFSSYYNWFPSQTGYYRVLVNFQFYSNSSFKSSRYLYTRYCFLPSSPLVP